MRPADPRGDRGALNRASLNRVYRRLSTLLVAIALVAGCSATPSDQVDDPVDEPSSEQPAPGDVDGDGAAAPRGGGDEDADDAPADATPEGSDGDGPDDAEPEPVPDPPPGRDALVAVANRLLAAAVVEATSGELAVLVVDEHGRELVAHAPDEPVLPASTLKVVTAASILTTLGPRYRVVTIVESTAPIDADGRVRGDLVLIGAGDPVLATPEYGRWVYPARPRTPLDQLADQLVAAGVTAVEGDVLAVAPGFAGPRVPDGWPDRYFSSFDARYSDGLTVDAGLRTIVEYPEPDDADDDASLGTGDGQAAARDDDDEAADTTDDGGSDPAGEVAGDREVDVDLGPPDVTVDHAADPPLQAVTELVRLLEERDVEVVGEAAEGPPDAPTVGRLAMLESPPMFDLLRFAVQRSDNQITDGLFRLAGLARTGTGSFESGERAAQQVLDRYGVDHAGAVFADGSGLSRDDRATVRMLVDLDRAMTASRHGPAWTAIMASMGQSGTLERRLAGTIAEGRFIGKTGTLQDVTALSGAVVDADGARYHLAVIANDAGVTRGVARALADELILLLVADLDGCSTDRPGEDDGLVGLPSLVVRC